MKIIRTQQGVVPAAPRPSQGGGLSSFCYEEWQEPTDPIVTLMLGESYVFGPLSLTLTETSRLSLFGLVETATPPGCGLTGGVVSADVFFTIQNVEYTPKSVSTCLVGAQQVWHTPVQTMVDLDAGTYDIDLNLYSGDGTLVVIGGHIIANVGNVIAGTTSCGSIVV